MEDWYVELVEHSKFNRGRVIKSTDLKMQKRDYEAYASVYRFKSDFYDYTRNNIKDGKPSVYGYLGSCSATYLWIDIDMDGKLEDVTQVMINIVNSVKDKYGINYDSIAIYFSGKKGYHIGIPTKCFNASDYYGDLLPSTFKYMAKQITSNATGLDLSVYNTTRYFRLPLSKHPSTGHYKILVDFELIQSEGVASMMAYSELGTNHQQYSFNFTFSESLAKLFQDSIDLATDNADLFVGDDGYTRTLSLKDNSSLFRVPDYGERNDLIYKMSYRLFNTELKLNEITDIMKFVYETANNEWRKNNKPRYSEMEMIHSINSAYSRTRVRPVQKVKAVDFASSVMDMYRKIKASQYIPTFDESISKDLHGGWEAGNFYLLIGKGGTMKSYLLQEEIIRSVLNKTTCLLFNLEMSDVTLFDRIWFALFKKSMYEFIEEGITESQVLSMGESIKEMLSNNLHISKQTDIDAAGIERTAKMKQDEIKKKIGLIGVDSVNGMKTYGSEVETAVQISKYVKETAKNLYCPIILINHANSSCPDYERNAASYVRGGVKFTDNADAYLSFSKAIDRERSNFDKMPQDLIPIPGILFCRFYNKRGSGNVIDKILKFDNGRIITLEDNPSQYEVSPSGGFSYSQQIS